MTPQLVTSQAYTPHVLKAIQHAKKRVYVLALVVQQEEDAAKIITALNSAANRGVEVIIMADFCTYSYINGHLSLGSIYSKQSQVATNMVNRLSSSGATFSWLGMQHAFLFSGRTHSKWIIADDTVFTFGGINLYLTFRDNHDYMFMLEDKKVADILAREQMAIYSADKMDCAYLSYTVPIENGEILFDGGIPGESLIYRKAIELIKQARSVLLVTQYCPNGGLATALKNTKYKVYHSKPNSEDYFDNWLIRFGRHFSGITNSYTKTGYIHAKFMIVTHHDGTKTAITGSHNFISYGVLLGTREIALMTTDTAIIHSLERFYETYIA